MANKKILIEVKVNDKATPEIKQTDGAVKGLSSSVKILNKEQRQQIVIEEKSKIVKKAQIDSLKRQAAAELQVAAATKQVKATSGLNNAILLESGRLASDAAYGFQGMANNLGQLVSLFQISAKNAGGFGAALKQVGGQILGTGGVLIGIQLLISFLPRIVKFFNGTKDAVEKAAEKIKEMTQAISEQIEMFDRLTYKHLPDFILTGKALDEVVSFLTNRFSKFRAGMEILKEKGLDKNEESVRNLVKSFGELQLRQKDLLITNEEYKKSVEKESETSLKAIRLRGKYNKILRELIALEKLFTAAKVEGIEKDEELSDNTRDKTERLESNLYKSGAGIVDIIDQENAKQKLLLQTIEKGFGETFSARKRAIKKESDLFFKNLKIERDAKNKEAKEDIALEKHKREAMLDALGAFFDASSMLAGEHTAAGKALAIVSATIDTYAAANNALTELKPPASFVAAAATIAYGLANVKKIMETGDPVGISPTTGGGTINAPDFNVVGTSETSQLAQAVGGREDSVVRAYVVSSEITSQQAADRQIINTAGL